MGFMQSFAIYSNLFMKFAMFCQNLMVLSRLFNEICIFSRSLDEILKFSQSFDEIWRLPWSCKICRFFAFWRKLLFLRKFTSFITTFSICWKKKIRFEIFIFEICSFFAISFVEIYIFFHDYLSQNLLFSGSFDEIHNFLTKFFVFCDFLKEFVVCDFIVSFEKNWRFNSDFLMTFVFFYSFITF